jgi:hypothetical protein
MRGRKHKLFLLDGAFFEWDVEKAELNVRKHGVTFEEAASVFLETSMAESSPIPTIPGMNQGFFLLEYLIIDDY